MADINNRNNNRKRRNAPYLRDVSKNTYKPVEREQQNRKRKRRNIKLQNKQGILIVTGIILVIIIALITIFSKNAYDVTVGNQSVGIIKKTSIEADDIKNTVVAGLEKNVGSKIQLNEEIALKAIRASEKDMVTTDYVISQVKKVVTYKVEAAVITVDGTEVAIISNQTEAQKLLDEIKNEYVPEDKKDKMEVGFVEDVQIVSKYVDSKEIISVDVAKEKFQQTTKVSKTYTVQSGDSISKIASTASMTLDEFYAENPQLSKVIKEGEVVNILVDKPFISVKTVETNVFTEIAKKEVKYQTNTSKPSSYQKVIQQGSDGQKEVTVQTIRINGFEEEQVVSSEKITKEPVDEIIEVGSN